MPLVRSFGQEPMPVGELLVWFWGVRAAEARSGPAAHRVTTLWGRLILELPLDSWNWNRPCWGSGTGLGMHECHCERGDGRMGSSCRRMEEAREAVDHIEVDCRPRLDTWAELD